MRLRPVLFQAASEVVLVMLLATNAAAQAGRVRGTVRDDHGQPIKGAVVRGENPNAIPRTFTASTDEKGRFAVLGLKAGQWTFSAEAPGFDAVSGRMNVLNVGERNPPVVFTLKRAVVLGAIAGSALAARDLQQELQTADLLFNQKNYDEAIVAYRAILAKAPSLNAIALQIAAAYRSKKEFDEAIAAYNMLLKSDPGNDRAKIGIGMTNLEKGDLQAAEETLAAAAESAGATREVFYNLGEVKLVKSEIEEATKWYEKAAAADPSWGRPLLKIGLIALGKGDKDEASRLMAKVIEVDPTSPEAGRAKIELDQLKK